MKYILIFLLFLSTSAFANIGKITAFKGEASILRDSKTLTPKVGFILEKNDKVTTSDNSRVQIVFKDNTIISLGKKTSFSINDYFYDELEPKKVNASFKFSKGVFKTITGKIALMNPNKFKLKTKSATIGIRGTTFFGEIKEDGSEDISCTFGSIDVITPQGTVNVPAGQRTDFAQGQAPTQAKKLTVEQKSTLETNSGAKANEKESGQDEKSVPLDTLHNEVAAISSGATTSKDDEKDDVPVDVDVDVDVNDDAKSDEIAKSSSSTNGLYGITMANLYKNGSHISQTSSLDKEEGKQMFYKKLVDVDVNAYLELHGSDYSAIVPIKGVVDDGDYTVTSIANGDSKEIANSEVSKTHTDGTKVTYSGSYGTYNASTHDIDSYLSWGTWSKTNGGIEHTLDYDGATAQTVSIDNSTWVAGKFTTPSEVPTIGNASYAGSVEGFHTAGSAMTGSIGIEVDFAENTVLTNLTVQYEDGNLFGNVTDIPGVVNRFSDNVEFKASGTVGSVETNIGGAFYGSGAKATGGVWTMKSGSEYANGTFAASKH